MTQDMSAHSCAAGKVQLFTELLKQCSSTLISCRTLHQLTLICSQGVLWGTPSGAPPVIPTRHVNSSALTLRTHAPNAASMILAITVYILCVALSSVQAV